MDAASQAMVLSEDRRMYMEIKTRLERDPHIKTNFPNIVLSYEGIKPRARERIRNVTELLIELEQRCIISIDKGNISSMGYIVDHTRSENVKQAFRNLKEKLQRNRDAVPMGRGNNNGDPLDLNGRSGMIRVPDKYRRMLKEKFEHLGLSEAEYFLEMLGHGLENKDGYRARRLTQHQINNSLSNYYSISEKIDKGLEIFEINALEDELFGSEDELLDHVVNVLKQIDINRLAKDISIARGKSVYHGVIL